LPIPTYALEVELAGVGGGWTNIISDVVQNSTIELEYGIRGGGPHDRMAQTGMLRFTLNNSTTNSGGLLGYYSPANTNKRSGWALKDRVRFSITYGGSTYYKFVGWLDEITPRPGQYLSRVVECVAVDWMDWAARTPVQDVATLTNTTADLVFTALVNSSPVAPISTTVQTGSDTLAYALDNVRQEESTIMAEIQRLCQSEYGLCYIKGNTTAGGELKFENRSARVNATSSFTFEDADITGLDARYGADSIRNKVRVNVYPRRADASNVVLFTLQNKPQLSAGQSITLSCPYVNPNEKGARVGGTSMVTPVATTDYTANTLENGSGTDRTANLTVSVPTFGGDSATVTLTNTHASSIYVTKLQLRGLGLYTDESVYVEKSDSASITAYGEQALTYEMPYQSSPIIGAAIASRILSEWKDPNTDTASLTFCATETETKLTRALTSDISTCFVAEERVTGLNEAFWINGVNMRVIPGKQMLVTWWLARADTSDYWTLGVSELGVSTRLAPL